MPVPPTHYLHELGEQAKSMSKTAGNERIAMVLQYVALGSMIVMAWAAAAQVLKDTFGPADRGKGRSR